MSLRSRLFSSPGLARALQSVGLFFLWRLQQPGIAVDGFARGKGLRTSRAEIGGQACAVIGGKRKFTGAESTANVSVNPSWCFMVAEGAGEKS